MKKVISLILVGLLLLMSAAGLAEEAKTDGFVIGFCNNYMGNTWRAQFMEMVEDTLKMYQERGVVADYLLANTNNDVTEQLNQINNMIAAGVDALIIDPTSSTALTSIIKTAQEAGILVVICNDAASYEGCYTIGWSDYLRGKVTAAWIADQMKAKGIEDCDIVEIIGLDSSTADAACIAEWDKMIEAEGMNSLGKANGQWSESETQTVMATFLSTYDKIDCVLNEDGGLGVVTACQNAGRELMPFIADYTKNFIDNWYENRDTWECMTFTCDPCIGSVGVMFTVNLLQGKEVDESHLIENPFSEDLWVNYIRMDPTYIVTPDGTAGDYMDELPNTTIFSIEEAHEICSDKEESYVLSIPYEESVVEALFK